MYKYWELYQFRVNFGDGYVEYVDSLKEARELILKSEKSFVEKFDYDFKEWIIFKERVIL